MVLVFQLHVYHGVTLRVEFSTLGAAFDTQEVLFTSMGIRFHIVSWGCLFEASLKYGPQELGPPEVQIPWAACVGVSSRFGIRTSGGANSRVSFWRL